MKTTTKLGLAALMLSGSALMTVPASAQVSIGIGLPGIHIWTGAYDYGRPCSYYRYYDVPAPRRCWGYLSAYWGPGIYADGDFIFRDRNDFYSWRTRPEYQHWRNHDFAYRANGNGHPNYQHGSYSADHNMNNPDRNYNNGGDRNFNTDRNQGSRGGDMQGTNANHGDHGDRGDRNRGDDDNGH